VRAVIHPFHIPTTHSYHISDLLSQRLTLKELPKDIILHKMLLPLCIQLGLRGKWDKMVVTLYLEALLSED